jgi:esterase/lipase superfamily enzyme
MRREHVRLHAPETGAEGELIAYGDYGRPVLVFPSEQGRAWDYEDRGMIGAVAGLIDHGRVKMYCADSFDSWTWNDDWIPLEERARRHLVYERWIVEQVVPWIHGDCGGFQEIVTTGSSFGAYHAVNFAFRRADLFPAAIALSGVYDVSVVGWGERGETVYFNNPMDYVSGLHGDHLHWLQNQLSIVLVCGQGAWEESTGALDSTKRFAGVLADRAIRHELDVWGWDVPHDWPSWRAQIAHHLPRFC